MQETKIGDRVGPTRVKWLYGAGCARFSVNVQFGRSGTRRIDVDVIADQIHEAAMKLRERPDEATFIYEVGIQRGRGPQHVSIHVPRAMMLGIAAALEGAVDIDDAGHRFYHWERPGIPKPCSTCYETLEANDASVEAARNRFMLTWTTELGVTSETIERLLSDFGSLPRKASR